MAERTCKKCGVPKDIESFPTCRENPSWRQWTCKDCTREKNNEYSRKRNEKDREKVNARNKDWVANHREQVLVKNRKYRQEHKEDFREWQRDWVRNRRKTDANYRIRCALRTRIHNALNGASKSARTMELIGCSIKELKMHLESQFVDGMIWENHGKEGWHIDHIRPCVSFDLTSPEQQKECFHFTNLQPLWGEDNIKKGSKLQIKAA